MLKFWLQLFVGVGVLLPAQLFAETLQFTSASYSVNEDAGAITITVSRTGGSAGEVSVDFASRDGSATAGSDYTPALGTLNWADGDSTSKTFSVAILDDFIREGDETVTLSLKGATGGATIGNINSAQLTILDNGAPGTIQFSTAAYSVSEDTGIATISVTRSGGRDGGVTVAYATSDDTAVAGRDYTAASGTLEWVAGDSEPKQVQLAITSDLLPEPAEAFQISLSSPTGQALLGEPAMAIITIDDVHVELPIQRLVGVPGETVSSEITVFSNNAGINISAENGVVTPDFIAETSGEVTYSFPIPADAQTGTVFADTITWTDSADNTTELSVEIVLTLSNISNLSPTQESTAKSLDAACETATGELGDRCDELSGLSEAEVVAALDQIAPQQVASQGTNSINISTTQLSNIQSRLLALRGDNGPLSLNGLALNFRGEYVPIGSLADEVVKHATGGNAGESIGEQGRLGAFINGRVDIGEQDITLNEQGYDFTTGGITFGIDYRLDDQLVIGGAFGYANTETDFSNNGGDQTTDAYTLSTYGNYYPTDEVYVDWIASFGLLDYDLSRNIIYTGVNTSTTGNTSGNLFGISVSAGGHIQRGEWLITPYGRFEYVHAGIDSYEEQGGSGLALGMDDQSISSLTTDLGGKISMTIAQNWGVLIPSIYAEWEHEYRDNRRRITAHYIESPNTVFSLPTDEPDRDYFNYGAELSAAIGDSKAGFIRYESVLGQDDFSRYTIEIGVRMAF